MMTAVSDNTGTPVGPATTPWCVSELLCFVTDKSNVLPVDDLVKICVDFYSESEIINARSALDSTGVRLPKRNRSSDRLRLTMEDIVKCVLDPSVQLPEFHAKNLARLPPVDVSHCDVSAILLELRALRAEVRSMGQIAATVEMLKTELDELKTSVTDIRAQVDVLQSTSVNRQWPSHHSSNATMDDFPPLTAVSGDSHFSTVKPMKRLQSVQQANDAVPKRVAKPMKTVIGASSQNQHVKSVITSRCVDVFISRLHPHTSENELLDCVNETAALRNIKTIQVSCSKLKSKYVELYSSFYVSVRVEAQQFKDAVDAFMSAESWPTGVLVKRFFKPKNGGT